MSSPVSISLQDVFEFWRANEAWNPKWQAVARDKGYVGWEEWRSKGIEILRQKTNSNWQLIRLEDPIAEVPNFFGGPFKAWKKAVYGDHDTLPFSKIVRHPFVQSHGDIQKLAKNFPKLTVISAVRGTEGMIIVEGMHRCCALSILAEQKQSHSGIVYMAVGQLRNGEKIDFSLAT